MRLKNIALSVFKITFLFLGLTQDFWTLGEFRYKDFTWPTSDTPLYRNFLLNDYLNDIDKLKNEFNVNVKGLVYVQVYHEEKETEQIIELAKNNPIIKGIVGWTDLLSEDVEENVKRLKNMSNGKLVGIRHLLQLEDLEWIQLPEAQRGLQALEDNGLAFDLSFYPTHLKHVTQLATKYPKMNMIIDHMARHWQYDMANTSREEWFKNIKIASQFPNIFCKVSGLFTEADGEFSYDILEPYIKHVLDCFGPKRCMYGADWPIFNLRHSTIQNTFKLMDTVVNKHFNNDQQIWNDIFYNNAIRIYKLV